MRIDYEKRSVGWRWRLVDDDDAPICGSVNYFRTKFFCRRDFKKRYLMLQRKRPHWPKYRDLES